MNPSSERGWWKFLESYPLRRREFETRHPQLHKIRLIALLGPLPVLVLGAIATLSSSPPRRLEGRPPAEGLPTAFVAVLIGFAILLAGLVAYGVVRWREDRAVGQIALAIGWGGVAVAYVVFAGCARELTTGMPALTCSSIPAAIVLGILWLTLWLSLGLLVDYRLWTRPGGGGGEPDLVPPEPP